MGSLVLTGNTSGSVTVAVPDVAGSNTATIGAATGTHYPFTAGTAVTSTSGTSIDFTSIPSWVKRVTVNLSGVSLSSTSHLLVQLGSGSATTSGYVGTYVRVGSSSVNGAPTSGFQLTSTGNATDTHNAVITFVNLTGNTWVGNGSSSTIISTNYYIQNTTGLIALGGVLDRVRVTSVSGTDTFDAGSINILYE